MARPLDDHRLVIGDDGHPPALAGVGGPALAALHQQHRRPYLGPDVLGVLQVEAVGGALAHVVVELPGVGAVGVLAHAVDGEVPGHLVGQVGVGLLHAPGGRLQGGVTAGHPPL